MTSSAGRVSKTQRPLFKYNKLRTPTSTRVLSLSSSRDPRGPLSGDVVEIDLEDTPTFTALSYVWGTGSAVTTISCESGDVPITQNCHDALVAIRRLCGRTVTIWVDAICIDQHSNEEKEQQIPLMERIYAQAATVYVWQGPGNERSDTAVDSLLMASCWVPSTPGIPWSAQGKVRTPLGDWLRTVASVLSLSFRSSIL